MADFIFKVSPNIILGSYSISRLGQFASEIGKKFMVILDPMLREVGIAEKATKSLDDHNIEYFVFEEVSEGAATKTIEQALTLARQAHVHGVIGIGGNKVLNVAKAVCGLYYESHDLYDFVEGAVPGVAPLPLVCVPTTIRSPYLFSTFTPVSLVVVPATLVLLPTFPVTGLPAANAVRDADTIMVPASASAARVNVIAFIIILRYLLILPALRSQ